MAKPKSASEYISSGSRNGNTITIEELIAEVNKAQQQYEEGISAQELADAWGCGIQTVRRRLRPAVMAGRIVAGRKRCKAISGIELTVPCYRVAEDK